MSAMSASASSSSADRYILVIGNCGVDKSTLIKSFMPINLSESKYPIAREDPNQVTNTTTTYQTVLPHIFLVDTIGLDKKGADLGAPRAMFEGKDVHILFIINSRRWQLQFDQAIEQLRWANPTDNVSKWWAYGTPPVETHRDAPELIVNLKGAQLKGLICRPVPRTPLPLSPAKSISTPTPALAKSAKVVPQKVAYSPPSKAYQWFELEKASLSQPQQRLYQLWDEFGWAIPQQTLMTEGSWLSIKSFKELNELRQPGEKLLEFHLHIMFQHASDAQNEALMKFVVHPNSKLKAHIDDLYQRDNQDDNVMSNEKYADYVEALFMQLWKCKSGRKNIISLLRTICRGNM